MDASEVDAVIGQTTPELLGPSQADLDRCVHCGLCLNACPTYRELGVEMDSPRGRIYQMAQVAGGAPVTDAYMQHIDLCLACRGCETACPSGVPYGRMVEAARAQIESRRERGPWAQRAHDFIFGKLLQSRRIMSVAGAALYLFEASGMKFVARGIGSIGMLGKMGGLLQLSPSAEPPFFFGQIGQTFPAAGPRSSGTPRYRVAFMAGCIANVFFARLNEATVRVLRRNGCEVTIPAAQGCCGALHLHSGLRAQAEQLARRNVEALADGGFDAIITNAAGCGSTLKEYGDILGTEAGRKFSARVRDVTEFLASIELDRDMAERKLVVTYQDSCHLAHGQRVRTAPRQLLAAIPGLKLQEMRGADICCGSAGIYNITQNEMSMRLLKNKMEAVNATDAEVIATANPGCMLQLQAGVRAHGKKQRVAHVIELLDEGYTNAKGQESRS
jgi:glycolate oxidase iron-sulfur subunit